MIVLLAELIQRWATVRKLSPLIAIKGAPIKPPKLPVNGPLLLLHLRTPQFDRYSIPCLVVDWELV